MCWAPAERSTGHCQDPEQALGEWWQLRAVGVRLLNPPSTSTNTSFPGLPHLSGELQPPQPAEQRVPSQGLNRELSSCALPWIPAGMEE